MEKSKIEKQMSVCTVNERMILISTHLFNDEIKTSAYTQLIRMAVNYDLIIALYHSCIPAAFVLVHFILKTSLAK